MQEPVAQRLRLTRLEGVGEGEQAQPGGQVGGDRDDLEPGLVDGELAGREPAQPGVFGVPDPVLDAGVGAVPGFEERQLPDRGVGGERPGSATRRPPRTGTAGRRGGVVPGG